jgi:hypothetical protein
MSPHALAAFALSLDYSLDVMHSWRCCRIVCEAGRASLFVFFLAGHYLKIVDHNWHFITLLLS